MFLRVSALALLVLVPSVAAQSFLPARPGRPDLGPVLTPGAPWLGGAPAALPAARAAALAFEGVGGTRHSLGRLPVSPLFLGFLTAADLDGDGAEDLVAVDLDITGWWGRTATVFVQRPALDGTPAFEPSAALAGLDVSGWAGAAAPIDLDLDGDFDLVVSVAATPSGDDPLVLYENVGTPTAPRFVRRAQSVVTGLRGVAAAADLDADGRTDLVVSNINQARPAVYRNVGAPGAPALAAVATPFRADADYPALTFLDVDGDGDLDAVGSAVAEPGYFENTGTAQAAVFEPRPAPFDVLGESFVTVAALDLTGDGRRDLVLAVLDGAEGTTTLQALVADQAARFVRARPAALRTARGVFDFGMPTLGDLDGDGDLDLLVGSSGANPTGDPGAVLYAYRNVGSAARPVFEPWPDAPTAALAFETDTAQPALADLDGDGRLDLALATFGDGEPTMLWFRNVGTAAQAVFERQPGSPLAAAAAGFEIAVGLTFADVDGDGDLDAAFLGASDAGTALVYAENTGSATAPVFVRRSGAMSPLPAMPAGHIFVPTLADLDGDGRADLAVGDLVDGDDFATGTVRVWRNVGGVFELAATPDLDAYRGDNFVTVAAGDLDADGHADLLVTSTNLTDLEQDVMLFFGRGGTVVADERGPVSGVFALRHAGAHPARGRARVEIAGADGPAAVEVYDALGRRVARFEDVSATVEIDLAGWAAGRYVVRATTAGAGATLPLTVVR